MQCVANYFSAKQRSSLDVELAAGAGDEAYLALLKKHLPYLIDVLQPDLVFFQAGVDIYEGDKLGKLHVTRQGLRRRNQLLFDLLARKGIKCVVAMGGGYPKDLDPASDAFQSVLQCHADVYRCCIQAHASRRRSTAVV
jgi:acetoin utilization deacetylase AcuC-like enzyme